MKRFWILFWTELNAWRHDPITAAGGFIPPVLILVAFSLLFGGRLSFKIAVINQDEGPYGQVLIDTFPEVISPLDNEPYYAVQDLSPDEVWQAFESYHIEGIWVIPPDFSARLEAGTAPQIEMHFMNYNDDRAKNHRIYSAEVLWHFYEKLSQNLELPAPPLALDETYPLPFMVDWVSVISIGIVLLSVTLGAIFNMYALTYKEQSTHVTLEFGLAPRSLAWVLLPKILLSTLFGVLNGTVFLVLIRLWLGFWPRGAWWAVWALFALVALFWVGVALVFGMRSRSYMAGAISSVLGGILIFFFGGGLSLVRYNRSSVIWLAWFFPNTYAVDPLRDMVLFNTWPVDFWPVLGMLVGLALVALLLGAVLTACQLRRLA